MMLEILYQDEFYIAVTKPSGLLVHPYKSQTNERENLLKKLKAQTGKYLYPIHRIDRPVSGVVIFALSSEAASKLSKTWADESTVKAYATLVRGELTEPGKFDFELSNEKKIKQTALTHYVPKKVFNGYTYLEVNISTGRKHQIRRHFSRRMHNLVGDTKYGKGKTNNFFREQFKLSRIFLHALRLEFLHPFSQIKVKIESPLDPELENVLNKMEEEII